MNSYKAIRFYRTEVSRNRASGGSGLGEAGNMRQYCTRITGHLHAAHSPLAGLALQ